MAARTGGETGFGQQADSGHERGFCPVRRRGLLAKVLPRVTLEVRRVSVLTHLDAPRDGIVRGPVAAIHGWIAGDATMDFEQLSLINARGTIIPLAAVDRPDVRLANVGEVSSGFTGWIDIRDAAAGPWQLRYKQREMPASTVLGLIADAADAQRFVEAKARKLAFVRTLLRCPVCHAAFDDTANQLRCANGHAFAAGADAYDLLTDDVRMRVGAIETDNVSAHGYDGGCSADRGERRPDPRRRRRLTPGLPRRRRQRRDRRRIPPPTSSRPASSCRSPTTPSIS